MSRRSRMHRTRTGKPIALTERDFEIFRVLRRYRYLRSTYLHAFAGGLSETRFKERLGDLFHEGYLGRPEQQWEFADARFRPVVHAIGSRGLDALRHCAIAATDARRGAAHSVQRQFLHTLLACEALASIELAARSMDGLRFIAWSEILARAPETTRDSAMPLRLPVPSGGHVTPDGVFGIEYRSESARRYRFFALEADRGTMPVSRSRPGQTSYLGKLVAYDDVLSRQVHRTHWGIPNLLVLTLTTSAPRLSEIVSRLGTGNPAFLFKAVESLVLLTPQPQLLTEPFARAGHDALSIDSSS